jgi:hypothetical protein
MLLRLISTNSLASTESHGKNECLIVVERKYDREEGAFSMTSHTKARMQLAI